MKVHYTAIHKTDLKHKQITVVYSVMFTLKARDWLVFVKKVLYDKGKLSEITATPKQRRDSFCRIAEKNPS